MKMSVCWMLLMSTAIGFSPPTSLLRIPTRIPANRVKITSTTLDISNNQESSHHHSRKQASRRRKLTKNTRKSGNTLNDNQQVKNIKDRSIAKGRDPLISLNMNLDYLAKSGAPRRAEELLLRIEMLWKEGYYSVKPDGISYNSVINAYASSMSDEYDSVTEVRRLLQRMEDLVEKDKDSAIRPNSVTLNTVILALAKKGDAEEAEKLLNRMEEMYQNGHTDCGPNTITFNSCIHAFAKAKQPEKAEEILRRMMLQSRQGDEPRDDIKADTIAFNTVLHAWAISRRHGGAQRSQQLLNHMEKLYHAGNNDVKPDVFSYTTVISAWAVDERDKNAVDRAVELLHRMEQSCAVGDEDMCPNTVAYTTVINALARSRKGGRALQAHDILIDIETQYMNGNDYVKPDLICYSSVIDAYARSGESYAGVKAVELLDHMIALSELGHHDVRPNTRFDACIFLSI